jgi:putative addiction module CopG family antidote
MQVALTPEQQDFVRRAVDSGRFARAEDAVQEALGLWVERERRRAEILAAVDTAQASIDRGEGIEITQQSMRELAEDVKRRGRARLAAEHQTTTR